MLNIMKTIIRRYWMFFLMMIVFGVVSFITIEDRAAIAVLLFLSFFAFLATDLKTIIYECSLPLDRKKVVDARFLLIFILLLLIMVIFTPKSLKYGKLSRFAPVLALTFLATSVWMMYSFCFGRGNGKMNLLVGILMTVFMVFMLSMNVAKSLFLDTMGYGICFFLMAAGIAIYGILWFISRNRIGKADL